MKLIIALAIAMGGLSVAEAATPFITACDPSSKQGECLPLRTDTGPYTGADISKGAVPAKAGVASDDRPDGLNGTNYSTIVVDAPGKMIDRGYQAAKTIVGNVVGDADQDAQEAAAKSEVQQAETTMHQVCSAATDPQILAACASAQSAIDAASLDSSTPNSGNIGPH